jgi:hypothetical protein
MGPKMHRHGLTWVALLGLSTSSMLGCGSSGPAGREAGLNLYTWSDYLAPDTIASFEKQSGVKVHVSYFDTNETLEARMLTGSSGVYLPLDKNSPISSISILRSWPGSLSMIPGTRTESFTRGEHTVLPTTQNWWKPRCLNFL